MEREREGLEKSNTRQRALGISVDAKTGSVKGENGWMLRRMDVDKTKKERN